MRALQKKTRTAIAALALALLGTMSGCSGFEFFAANAPAHFGSFSRDKDVAYGPQDRERLDIYSPKNARHLPVVIFFYGGFWSSGSKANYAFVGAALAARGFVTVVPDYRLYPQVRFPQFIEDGASAVAWVEQHAAEFGADPDRLILMGHSAGAHLAAMLAYDDRYLERAGAKPAAIIGIVGLSGPYALDPDTDTLRTIFGAPYGVADWQPVRFASPHSPPTLLLHGESDSVVAVSHTEKMRDALLAEHVLVETKLYPNRGHADTIASFSLIARHRTDSLDRTVEFLNRIAASTRH